jgi:DNA-binding transcriptional ArsR family regulator
MVEYIENHLNRTYAAIADPTRRAILMRLTQGEARVTELAEPFAMSLNAVSKHLRVLEQAGLVQRRVQGRDHYLALQPEALRTAAAWLDTYRQFWEKRLDTLETFLQQSPQPPKHAP